MRKDDVKPPPEAQGVNIGLRPVHAPEFGVAEAHDFGPGARMAEHFGGDVHALGGADAFGQRQGVAAAAAADIQDGHVRSGGGKGFQQLQESVCLIVRELMGAEFFRDAVPYPGLGTGVSQRFIRPADF